MTLTFAETYNMVIYLTKFDASEGFNQIIDFLNGSSIMYALTVKPNIYVSCIKQFWTTVAVKKVNDIIRLQALVNKKKVVVTEATIREALRLDDAEGVKCLPNEEIFAELARMGYEKPSTKLTFSKSFFSSQWKFLIHTILQCMSAKRTSWNEFSSSMASAVICLSSGRKINFSKYIFDSLVRNVDSPSKFYMYPRFLQLIIRKQAGDLLTHTTKRYDEVPTVAEEPSIPSPTPPTLPPQPSHDIPSTSQAQPTPLQSPQGRKAESQAEIYKIDLEHASKVLNMQDDESEPAKVQEVVDVVTTAKIITEVVTATSKTITAASEIITAAEAQVLVATLTVAPLRVTTAPNRRRKRVVIRDPQEESTTSIIIPTETNS
nr:hypothetical protein [Tanacetum cinerariifolium]